MRDELSRIAADPLDSARAGARPPLPKRFYSEADVAPAAGGGFAVRLDGRPVRTPARRPLVLPTEAAAAMVAAEFAAQGEHVDPATMPVTRLANTVIDGVASDPEPVMAEVAGYLGSDLLCYRAGAPERLVERQAAQWDPVLDWAREEFGARFVLSEGVMPVAQPAAALAATELRLRRHEGPWAAGALHVMTTLTGSALLALAVADRRLTPAEAWTIAHVDEDWTIEQWGRDEEAAARRAAREADFLAAARLLHDLRAA